jgi:two-component sensor histidine kinase
LLRFYEYDYRPQIVLEIEVENCKVQNALPIGLLINEMIVNSLKHAFDNVEEPKIKIGLAKVSNHWLLKYSDNGDQNMDQKSNIKQSDSFGSRLIELLVEQIKGSLAISFKNGLTYEIRFAQP